MTKINKKKLAFEILYIIFNSLTFFFIGGGIGSLIIATCTGDPMTTYGYICCYGAFPATCFRAIFQWLDKNQELYIEDNKEDLNENDKE